MSLRHSVNLKDTTSLCSNSDESLPAFFRLYSAFFNSRNSVILSFDKSSMSWSASILSGTHQKMLSFVTRQLWYMRSVYRHYLTGTPWCRQIQQWYYAQNLHHSRESVDFNHDEAIVHFGKPPNELCVSSNLQMRHVLSNITNLHVAICIKWRHYLFRTWLPLRALISSGIVALPFDFSTLSIISNLTLHLQRYVSHDTHLSCIDLLTRRSAVHFGLVEHQRWIDVFSFFS